MSATCPACGVAVVPGYVRCPKCQRPLPGNRRAGTVAGGTVSGGAPLPLVPIIGGAVVVLGVILYLVVGRSDAKPAKAGPATGSDREPVVETPQAVTPTPDLANEPDREPNRIDPTAVARDLERALKNQRLWSTVDVGGRVIDVTSGSCRDANMIPMIDAARTALHNAGLTRLRCLENSGAVVFEREL